MPIKLAAFPYRALVNYQDARLNDRQGVVAESDEKSGREADAAKETRSRRPRDRDLFPR